MNIFRTDVKYSQQICRVTIVCLLTSTVSGDNCDVWVSQWPFMARAMMYVCSRVLCNTNIITTSLY